MAVLPSWLLAASATRIYPAWAIPEYARSLFMLVCDSAITLPTTMDAMASAQIKPNQCACTADSDTLNTRTNAANTAALVVTDMNAVTGVGAPSYTSGVHM